MDSPRQPSLERIRHSAAHILAQAVRELFPEAQFGIGTPVADGFYYDIGLPRTLNDGDLAEIEHRMRRIIAENHPFVRCDISFEEAQRLFQDQPYKLEIIAELADRGEEISTYRQDSFEDLCRGPHVDQTGDIPSDAIALTTVSGAYWRGDERRPMLQRIYGTAWRTAQELEAYRRRLDEAQLRDHRKLGRELDLFSISEAVGPGLILWHPKGAMVRVLAEDFCRQAHLQSGYEWVFSPHIGRAQLWETSGHLDFFGESMYPAIEIEGAEYYAKPMNCPFHIEIFRSRQHSYRDLPKRLAEYGTVYRYERSGVLHGLTRVRGFTQDDAHIFCRADQVDAEIEDTLAFSLAVLRAFGLTDFMAYLATRPEKAVGALEDWQRAEQALQGAIEAAAIPHKIDIGGGAFYGPKIDLKARDALGREWQLSTIQFDFNLPERFDLEYIAPTGQARRPYMVHRALMGSIERFLGVLIEHYAGAFPLWLAPVQVSVLPVSDKSNTYGDAIARQLRQHGIRVELDTRDERVQAKIRDAQLQKVPYMVIVGTREEKSGTVAVRARGGERQENVSVREFLAHLNQEGTVLATSCIATGGKG